MDKNLLRNEYRLATVIFFILFYQLSYAGQSPSCKPHPLPSSLYTNKTFGHLDCKPSDFTKTPDLVIFGEAAHSWMPIKSGAINTIFVMALDSIAKRGQIVLGREGMFPTWDSPDSGKGSAEDIAMRRIKQGLFDNGIEDDYLYGLGELPVFAQLLRTSSTHDLSAGSAIVNHVMTAYLGDNFLRAAWANLKRPLKDPDEEIIAEAIDLFSCHQTPAQQPELINGLSAMDGKKVAGVLEQWFSAYIDMTHSMDLSKLPGFSVQKSDYFLPDGQPKPNQVDAVLSTFGQKWRNQLMSANAAVLYCTAAKAGIPAVVLDVGEEHVTGLKQILDQYFAKSGFDSSKISIFGKGKYTSIWDLDHSQTSTPKEGHPSNN